MKAVGAIAITILAVVLIAPLSYPVSSGSKSFGLIAPSATLTDPVQPLWNTSASAGVVSAAISANDRYVVAIDGNGDLEALDDSGNQVWQTNLAGDWVGNSLSISPDSAYIAVGTSVDSDGNVAIQLYSISGNRLWSYVISGDYGGHPEINAIDVSSGASTVAAIGCLPNTGYCSPNTVYVFDRSGDLLQNYTSVSSMKVSNDGLYVAATSSQSVVLLSPARGVVWNQGLSGVASVAFLPNDTLMVGLCNSTTSSVLRIGTDGSILARSSASSPAPYTTSGGVLAQNSSFFLTKSSSGRTISLMREGTNAFLWSENLSKTITYSLGMSAAGSYIAVGSCLFDAASEGCGKAEYLLSVFDSAGYELWSYETYYNGTGVSVIVSSDGNYILLLSSDIIPGYNFGIAVPTLYVFKNAPPATLYRVSFAESGLPPGTPWSVTVGILTAYSGNATIGIDASAGILSYKVNAVAGFLSIANSSATISGPSTIVVKFEPSSSSSTSTTALSSSTLSTSSLSRTSASPTTVISLPPPGPDTNTITKDTTLNSDLKCVNLVIEAGVTLTTNGSSIICSGTFYNQGTVTAGFASNGGSPPTLSVATECGATNAACLTYAETGGSEPSSYGGSGGGGVSLEANGNGGRTLAAGGSNGSFAFAGPGGTPNSPALSNSLIVSWYNQGMRNILTGAGGGASGEGGPGGSGSYGIYIQASAIYAGTIDAAGQGGSRGGGGGGGGVVLLAYGSGGLVNGTYYTSGGAGGGKGGDGQILTFDYGNQPPVGSSSNSAPTSGGGIPEFPPQFLAVAAVAVVVTVSYVALRRRLGIAGQASSPT